MPQLIRLLLYLLVAYSFAMFAHPPSTFWQLAACSLADPSPGFTANIVDPIPVFLLSASGNCFVTASITGMISDSTDPASSPFTLHSSAALTSFARPTYIGSLRDSANSASPRGFDLYDEVSPEGISSSVVVTGSWISDTTFRSRLSVSASIAGQSLMFGPKWISCFGSATPFESNTLFAYMVESNEYLYFLRVSFSIWFAALVRKPLLAAVAAIDLASMSATDDI